MRRVDDSDSDSDSSGRVSLPDSVTSDLILVLHRLATRLIAVAPTRHNAIIVRFIEMGIALAVPVEVEVAVATLLTDRFVISVLLVTVIVTYAHLLQTNSLISHSSPEAQQTSTKQ